MKSEQLFTLSRTCPAFLLQRPVTQMKRETSTDIDVDSKIPGPGWFGTAKFHMNFVRDQVGAFEQLVDAHGPAVRFRFGGLGPAYLLSEPELIEQVLLRRADSFHKGALTHELDDFVGRGLLTAEDEHWRQQRKLVAPNLQRKQIAHYADIMVEETDRMMEQWSDGGAREFDDDMMEITLRVVVQALFDLDIDQRVERVGEAIDDTMSYFHEIMHSVWRWVPNVVPSPSKRAYQRAYDELNGIIYDLIDERRERDEPGDDLLYRLIEATDDEGRQMSDKQLRDEVITLFVAGHETTALAITYASFLIATHDRVGRRLREEVDEVLGDDRPGAAESRELPYTEAVVKEAMRLYPPVWAIDRRATEDVELDGLTIPEGAHVFMSQAVNHKSERFFDDPETFRPARWEDDLRQELPDFAYAPFGGGPRICIGRQFALLEAKLTMATIGRNYKLYWLGENDGAEPPTSPQMTLRMESGQEFLVTER